MKTLTKQWLLLAALMLAIAVPTLAVGQNKTPAKQPDAEGTSKGLRVYWSTHSMLWYAPGPFGALAKAGGFNEYKEMGHSRIGASRVEQHWKQAQEKKALEKGDIDVFVMAPIGYPDPGIENFVKLGLEHNPNMRFTAQISWGCFDQDMNLFGKGFPSGAVDRNKTPEQLQKINADNIKTAQAQADEINKKYGKGRTVLFLVPSAQSNVALRTKIHNKKIDIETQGELFRDPISHPGPAQEALNTYLYYAVIFRKSPVGLPRTSLLTKKYDDKVNLALQELAWETAINYPYSGVTGKPGDKTTLPAQPDKKDTPPQEKKDPQSEKKDQPQKGKGFPDGFPKGFPDGFPKGFPDGFPKGFPALPGKGTGTVATPPIGSVLSPAALDKLKLTDDQQRQVQELQRVVESSLQGILNAEQRKLLEELKKPKK